MSYLHGIRLAERKVELRAIVGPQMAMSIFGPHEVFAAPRPASVGLPERNATSTPDDGPVEIVATASGTRCRFMTGRATDELVAPITWVSCVAGGAVVVIWEPDPYSYC